MKMISFLGRFLVFFLLFGALSAFKRTYRSPLFRRQHPLSANRREFYVPKTIKKADGTVAEELILCTCSNSADFVAIRKHIGELVDSTGTLVHHFSDLVNGTVYNVMLDGVAMQRTVVNLVGNTASFARSAELQMVHALGHGLIRVGNITVNNEIIQVSTVEEVIDHVTMNNPSIQKTALTPDVYAYGKLTDGRRYEAIGDTKVKVAGRMTKHLDLVQKYVKFLSTPGTTVSGSFNADRVPAPVIIGVLGTYVHDADAVGQAQRAGVVLLAASGKVLTPTAAVSGVTLLRSDSASKLPFSGGDNESDEGDDTPDA